MAARGVPLPQSASLLSVVQSPHLLARLGLIVREAATARGLPHPGTVRGGDGLEGVGEVATEPSALTRIPGSWPPTKTQEAGKRLGCQSPTEGSLRGGQQGTVSCLSSSGC